MNVPKTGFQYHHELVQTRPYFWPLLILLFLFCLRVLGQILVMFFHVTFLPPAEEWFSGLLPYPELLTAQILIIWLYGKICLDFGRRRGFFVNSSRRLGAGLLIFGSLYLGAMILRYIIRMSLYPHERWTGGCIPIFFHWVLSTFILVLGSYHWRTTSQASKPTLKMRVARVAFALIVLMAIAAWATFLLTPSLLAYKLGLRRSEYAVRAQKQATMLTSDGTTLVADIYHPQHITRTPTVLVRIPLTRNLTNSLFSSIVGKMWAERGYTVVFQGTRGRFGSGGKFYPLREDQQDGKEMLQWIAKQIWYDGHILTWGGSAFGHTQWAIADQTSPGVSAMMIYFASSSFHDMFYPGGAFSLDSALTWAIFSRGERDQATWPGADQINLAAKGLPITEADQRATGQKIDFFQDWAQHPVPDSYWSGIDGPENGQTKLQSLKSPVLMMGGWYDPFLPMELKDYEQIKQSKQPGVATHSRLLIGPWTHASEVWFPDGTSGERFRPRSLALSLPWFDENSFSSNIPGKSDEDRAPVKLFVMGKNEWRSEQEWPLARTQYTPFFLGSGGRANSVGGDGTLEISAPLSSQPFDAYLYDPQNPVPTAGGAMIGPAAGIARQNSVENRQDVLVYTAPVLTQDMEVTGPVSADLYVSTSAPNTDFTAKLVDVQEDGSAYNISEGILRRSFTTEPNPTPQLIHVELWPTSMVFRKGHKIRLEISSSNFPRFDANPNTGRTIAFETKAVCAKQALFHSIQYPSRLTLPIIPNP